MTETITLTAQLTAESCIKASRAFAALAASLADVAPATQEAVQPVATLQKHIEEDGDDIAFPEKTVAPAPPAETVAEAAPTPPAAEQETGASELFDFQDGEPDWASLKRADYPVMSNGVEVDFERLPWDARIHSAGANRTVKKTGIWKLKKNIETNSPGLVDQVKAELKAAMESGAVAKEAAAPAAVTTVTSPATPAAPTPPAASGPDFTGYIAKLNEQKKLEAPDALNTEIAKSFEAWGITSLADLLGRTDAHDVAEQWFQQWVAV